LSVGLKTGARGPSRSRSSKAISQTVVAAFAGFAFGGLMALGGCATESPAPPPSRRPPAPSHYHPQARAPRLRPRTPSPALASLFPLSDLKDWREDDHVQALAAYRLGCGLSPDPTAQARRFFEANFRAQILTPTGLLTAYFAPEYPARHTPDAEFSAALRPKPDDLVFVDSASDAAASGDQGDRHTPRLSLDGALSPYPNRTDIELLPPVEPLAWMRPEDLFRR
jgi:membrane-bound lytic murein transglycosylase A